MGCYWCSAGQYVESAQLKIADKAIIPVKDISYQIGVEKELRGLQAHDSLSVGLGYFSVGEMIESWDVINDEERGLGFEFHGKDSFI